MEAMELAGGWYILGIRILVPDLASCSRLNILKLAERMGKLP